MQEESIKNLELLHQAMKDAKKVFFDELKKHHELYGKANVGSIIKSTGCSFTGRKFVVTDFDVGVSSFSSDMDIRCNYTANLLDGKGNKVAHKIVRFSERDFDLISR